MKLSLDLKTSLSQTLTPQQIQYLKLLQLPIIQLEQQVQQEIEQNPMLEEISDDLFSSEEEFSLSAETDGLSLAEREREEAQPEEKKMIDDSGDPFEFHKMIFQDDSDSYSGSSSSSNFDDDDNEPFQIKSLSSFSEELIEQLRLLPLTEEEMILAEHIIGNIDVDGYLRRDLTEIVTETNQDISDRNFLIQKIQREQRKSVSQSNGNSNPALQFKLGEDSSNALRRVYKENPEIFDTLGIDLDGENSEDQIKFTLLKFVSTVQAETILKTIQELDPPGVGSRSIQECLLAQCNVIMDPDDIVLLARDIITDAYDAFTKKHYPVIMKQFRIDEEELREVLDFIRALNPRPGGGDYQSEMNTVIPDFVISIDEEKQELIINVNDSRLPQIRLNQAYEKLKKETQYKLSNKETKEWIRNKYEDAKFLIQAIRQRKSTMLKVMTAIAHIQEGFFFEGHSALKPLIYKNVAEKTGLDISTVCRIVNGKYVQTRFGTFELKFFFSESLPSDEGEEVSTRVLKQELETIINSEDKKRPYSDEKLSKVLKEKGFNVARRTVAKYREQLKIPVARLRKEL